MAGEKLKWDKDEDVDEDRDKKMAYANSFIKNVLR